MNISIEEVNSWLMDFLLYYGPKLLGAIAVLLIGLWVINRLVHFSDKAMEKRQVDDSLRPFLKSLFGILLKLLLVISVMSMAGIAMTSFIAILAAAGLAVGLALSGTLQNFAGGVLVLLIKPFKKGDYVEAQGFSGTVDEIQIFHTVLRTPDNRIIMIPNGPLSTGPVTNYSREQTRRVDFTFGIAYGDEYNNAREVISKMVAADDRILNEPEPFIALKELADSSVNITVRVWTKAADYWPVYWDMHRNVYEQFPKNDLNFPYPQMDVHVSNNDSQTN